MSKVIIVAGDTGTGKTRSLLNLNPKETYIFNTLNKALPFKGSNSLYNAENKNMYSTDNYAEIINILNGLNTKRPEIKNIIIDDLGFVMLGEFFTRSAESGYNKFSDFGKHMQQIISTAKTLRDDLNVILVFHEDSDYSNNVKTNKKLKLIGQMLEDKYNPLAVVTVCLFTDVNLAKDGTAEYSFITNRTMINGEIIPAKSPEGMFESLRIPNDLNLVITKMNEYYNG